MIDQLELDFTPQDFTCARCGTTVQSKLLLHINHKQWLDTKYCFTQQHALVQYKQAVANDNQLWLPYGRRRLVGLNLNPDKDKPA